MVVVEGVFVVVAPCFLGGSSYFLGGGEAPKMTESPLVAVYSNRSLYQIHLEAPDRIDVLGF